MIHSAIMIKEEQMNKNYLIQYLACLLLVISFFVACGDERGDSFGPDTRSTWKRSSDNHLTVMTAQSGNTKGLQAMAKKLEEEEGIILDIQVIPDDQFDNLFTMRINSGEAPDLIRYNVPHLYGFVDAPSLLADLSDGSWVDSLLNPDMSTHSDGKVYSWTYQSSSGFLAMMYNKDLFASVGYETPPTTVEEFYDLCDKLKTKGITPIGQPSDVWVPQIYMAGGNGRALGSTQSVYDFASAISTGTKKFSDYPELAEVIDYYLSFFEKGYMNQDYLTTNVEGIQTKIVNGEIAMLMAASQMFNNLQESYPDAEISMFNMPAPYDSRDMLSANISAEGFCVPKTSKNIDLAKKVFELWSTPEYLALAFAEEPGFPAYPGIDGGAMKSEILDMYNSYARKGHIVTDVNGPLNILTPLYYSALFLYYQEAPKKGWTGMELLERFQKDVDQFLSELEG